MSLAKRIIPTLLNKRGQLVKGEGFTCDRVVGHALQAAKIYAARSVDELMILDVTATEDGREPDYEFVKALSESNFSPVTVGGGIKTSEHVRKLLQSGADKVCISSAVHAELLLEGSDDFVYELSERYGKSTIVVSIDIATYEDTPFACDYAQACEERGAGEILLQSIPQDGTMKGYDLPLIKAVSEAVSVPVIASGGCSGYEDMYNAIQAGASAVAAGALFQFTEATPRGAAEYLHEKGVEVRL